MELNEELKKEIDSWTYEILLFKNRFLPIGDSLFQGESGNYILERMSHLRNLPGGQEEHVRSSKVIGR